MSTKADELNAWMETTKPRTDSVGVHIGFDAVKPDCLLPVDDQVFCGQEAKLEKMSEPNGSAFGELVEDLGLVDQEAPAQVQEERKTKAPKSSGEEMNLAPSGVTCPTQEEENEGSQGPEVTPGCVSPVDILLSMVGSLKTCEKTLLNATAVKLTVILHEQKTDLKDKVSEIVEQLYWEISSIPVGRARRAALNVVTSLAEVSPEDVVSSLLKHSLPCNSTASEMWKSLCTVPETNTKIMWYLLRELKRRASLPEHSCSAGDGTGYEEWLAPLAAMRALGEMLKLFTCTGAIHGFYPTLFLAILTQIHFLVQLPGYGQEEEEEEEEEKEEGWTQQTAGSSGRANSHPPVHCKHVVAEHVRFAVDTLRTLMLRDHNYKVLLGMEMNKGWGLLSSKEEHLRGVVLLARILATVTNHHLLGLLAEVIPRLDAQEEERALTAKALFAGFLCSKVSIRLVPKRRVLAKLEQWQADPQPVVRWLSFQGLENLALQKQKLRSLEGLVSKMLRGLNEAHEKTVRDTLGALPKILNHHQRRLYVGSLCVLVAKKLRPLLEDEREPERSLAVRLFGELLPWVNVRHKAQMRERILTHLVPFVLHLCDPSQQVVETHKWTLARCSNFLGWNLGLEILTLAYCDCQKALDKICKSLVQWYPDKILVFLSCTLDYLKSSKAPLRRAAGVFAGFLAFYMNAQQLSQEALIALQQGLDGLLSDPEPSIAEVASVSILQVKEVLRAASASASPIPSALARMFCCLQPGEKEKPQFEDSPYKRKSSPEGFLSIPQSLHERGQQEAA